MPLQAVGSNPDRLRSPAIACLTPIERLVSLLAEDLARAGVDENAPDLTTDTHFDSIHRVLPLQKLDTKGLAAGIDGEGLGQRFGRADELAAIITALNKDII